MVKRVVSFKLDPELIDALKSVKSSSGLSEGEQVRKALVDWMRHEHGFDVYGRAPEPMERRALAELYDLSQASPTKDLNDREPVIIPNQLGPECGGGLPWTELTGDEIAALADLYGRLGRAYLEFSTELVNARDRAAYPNETIRREIKDREAKDQKKTARKRAVPRKRA